MVTRSEDEPIGALARVGEACRRFESVWQAGAIPRIEDFLGDCVGPEREFLINELLHIDRLWRQRLGDAAPVTNVILQQPAEDDEPLDPTMLAHGEQDAERSDFLVPQRRRQASRAHRVNRLPIPSIPGYADLQVIARGGMGMVYKARHLRLGRTVALKLLMAADSPAAQKRFSAEAEAVARLQHPNIVQIYEVGEYEDGPYLALEYLRGGSLRELLATGPLLPEVAARLVADLALAMHHAHSNGIIHRDLKPGNVLLAVPTSQNGPLVPKITDFGLAKDLTEGAGTLSGDLLGTPQYMAPEQASGVLRHIGPATDVYALGAILYECLAGRPPFEAAGPLPVLHRVLNDEPAPFVPLRGVPRDLEAICFRCLEKDAHSRYSTALALADDLTRYLNHEPVRARPIGTLGRMRRWARKRPVVTVLLALLAGLLLTGLPTLITLYLQARQATWEAKQNEAAAQHAKAESDQLRREAELQVARLWASTGAGLLDAGDPFTALVWDMAAWEKEAELASPCPDLDEQAHRLRAAASLARSPKLVAFWSLGGNPEAAWLSPDGLELLALQLPHTVRRYSVASGAICPLRSQPPIQARETRCSADGRLAALLVKAEGPEQSEERLWDVESGKILGAMRYPTELPERLYGSVRLSPDGTRLVRLGWLPRQKGTPAKMAMMIWNTQNGEALTSNLEPIGATPLSVKFAEFTPDSRFFLTGNREGVARVWNAETGKPVTQPLNHTAPISVAALSPDGVHVATGQTNGTVLLWRVSDGQSRALANRFALRVTQLVFDTTGRRLLGASEDGGVHLWDVGTGQSLTPLMTHTGAVRSVSFSPDGQWLLTAGNDGTARIWHAETGKLAFPLLPHGVEVRRAMFLPDGRRVLTVASDGLARVWDLGGVSLQGRLLLGHHGGVNVVRYRPDGRRLASGSDDATVRLWDSRGEPTGAVLHHKRGVTGISWHPSGMTMATTSGREAQLWNIEHARELSPLFGSHLGAGTGLDEVRFLPGPGRLALAFLDHVNLFDLLEKRDKGQVYLPSRQAMEMSASAHRLATFTSRPDKSQVGVFDTATGKSVCLWETPKSLNAIAIRLDGKRVATGGLAGLRVRDVEENRELVAVEQLGRLRLVRFSADRELLLTANDQGVCQVCDASTGRSCGSAFRVDQTPILLDFIPGSEWVLTVRGDGQTRLWDWWLGLPVTPPLEHGAAVRDATLSPDGRRLALAGRDGAVREWLLPEPNRTPRSVLCRLSRLLAARRHDGELPLPAAALVAEWTALKGQVPELFVVSKEAATAWHVAQAQESQREKHHRAALFHLDRALELGHRPELQRLREEAAARAEKALNEPGAP